MNKKSWIWLVFIFFTLISVGCYVLVLVFDANNWFNGAGIILRFDWIAAGCSLLSALASAFLGVVAIKQNALANEQNERLARINESQLENSIISQNYPLIRFCKKQIIKVGESMFTLKFYDTRNTPIKEVHVRNISLIPYLEPYKVDETKSPVGIREEDFRAPAEFTPYHEDNEKSEGFYFVNIPTSPEIFQKEKYYRLEFDMDVISTTGVITMYKYRLLIERGEKLNSKKNRRYPKVYHQFCEFKKIMSERRYETSK